MSQSLQLTELFQAILGRLDDIRAKLSGAQKDYLTVDEVASTTHRAPYTVRGWIKTGRIDAIRVNGTGPRGRLLIPRAELRKLIALGDGGDIPEVALAMTDEQSN